MARDATARLYDVDEDRVEFIRQNERRKYDEGEIFFYSRPGNLIDLDQLSESIKATRLGISTRSGLVQLEVTAVGHIRRTEDGLILDVEGSPKHFDLEGNDEMTSRLGRLAHEGEGAPVSLTGVIKGWEGRWPTVLKKLPPKTLVVSAIERESQ